MSKFKAVDPNYRKRIETIFANAHFGQYVGLEIHHLEPGISELKVRARKELLNFHQILHGGVSATLADMAAGTAAGTLHPPGWANVTVSMNLNYLSPGKGEEFFARGEVVRMGRTLIVVDVNVTCDGKQIVTGTITLSPVQVEIPT